MNEETEIGVICLQAKECQGFLETIAMEYSLLENAHGINPSNILISYFWLSQL